MYAFLLVVHVLAAIGLIGLVLLQHGKGADAGAAFGSGASGSIFGARGPASFLTRLTAVLAGTFFVTSLSLAYMASKAVDRESVVERVVTEQNTPVAPPETDVPAVPADIPAPADVPEAPVEQPASN